MIARFIVNAKGKRPDIKVWRDAHVLGKQPSPKGDYPTEEGKVVSLVCGMMTPVSHGDSDCGYHSKYVSYLNNAMIKCYY